MFSFEVWTSATEVIGTLCRAKGPCIDPCQQLMQCESPYYSSRIRICGFAYELRLALLF